MTSRVQYFEAVKIRENWHRHDPGLFNTASECPSSPTEPCLFVIDGRGSSAFDMQSANWPRLARRMRLQDSARAPAAELLRTRYTDVTEAVRETYLAVLGIC